MAKSSPEKLAAALKANLKRRKQAKPEKPPAKDLKAPAKPAKKPDFP